MWPDIKDQVNIMRNLGRAEACAVVITSLFSIVILVVIFCLFDVLKRIVKWKSICPWTTTLRVCLCFVIEGKSLKKISAFPVSATNFNLLFIWNKAVFNIQITYAVSEKRKFQNSNILWIPRQGNSNCNTHLKTTNNTILALLFRWPNKKTKLVVYSNN